MAKKNNNKKNIAAYTVNDRPTWKGCYERVTPTKKEKMNKMEKKHKKDFRDFD